MSWDSAKLLAVLWINQLQNCVYETAVSSEEVPFNYAPSMQVRNMVSRKGLWLKTLFDSK
jgi:hypothetical protein